MVGGELGNMVRSRKKSAKKVQEPTEPIEEPKLVVVATDNVDEPKVLEDTLTPTVVDETPKLLQLLNDAPDVPYIATIESAVTFVDKYRVWKEHVKAET